MAGAPTSSELQLAAMPGEILNKIYNYVFTKDIPLDLWVSSIDLTNPNSVMARLQFSSKLARPNFGFGLLRVNHRFHNECTAIFYSSTRFDFSQPGGWDGLLMFLKIIGKQNRAHLQRIGVFIPLKNGDFRSVEFKHPDGGDSHWNTPIMDNNQNVMKECCCLLASDATLRECVFIIPRGVEVKAVGSLVPRLNGDFTHSIWKYILPMKLSKRVLLEVQEDGFLGVVDGVVDRTMERLRWKLVRKAGSYRLRMYLGDDGKFGFSVGKVEVEEGAREWSSYWI
ncbi:MAG: hypothetical protein M1835_004953 [Candelina submexicana]|nr:MAG: hypothetical protein M1835_004953 [Candelina submexicana]